MSVLPVVFSIILVCLGFYFDRIALIFLPHAFLMPFDVSLLTMIYLSHYKEEEIGIPEKDLPRTIFLFIMNGFWMGLLFYFCLFLFFFSSSNSLSSTFILYISSNKSVLFLSKRSLAESSDSDPTIITSPPFSTF
jgi:hypothetical protein